MLKESFIVVNHLMSMVKVKAIFNVLLDLQDN